MVREETEDARPVASRLESRGYGADIDVDEAEVKEPSMAAGFSSSSAAISNPLCNVKL